MRLKPTVERWTEPQYDLVSSKYCFSSVVFLGYSPSDMTEFGPKTLAEILPSDEWIDWDVSLSKTVLKRILNTDDPEEIEIIRAATENVLLKTCGDSVRLRGLVEFSNRCVSNCYYCGIRRDNRQVPRYSLTLDEIVDCAHRCMEQGYGSIVLQSGERSDAHFVHNVTETIRAIKAVTRSNALPQGLGITLSIGEQAPEAYAEWFSAGAHRYLLRIETSSPELFAALHPENQRHETRLDCLRALKRIGYQVGTGVMIGLPGQTIDDLVKDLLFFRAMDVDMVGMGPYIPHAQSLLPGSPEILPAESRLSLGLRMIAATRLFLRDVNIAATTALRTLANDGYEQGLRHGANVIMPQVTPLRVCRIYTLYDGKPYLDESTEQGFACLKQRISAIGRQILRDDWGDSAHFVQRTG